MIGELADQSYYDPMTGVPTGGTVQPPETPQDPREFTSDWAWHAATHPQAYEPQGTMWPDPNAKPVARTPVPGDPDYQWAIGQLAAPFHAASQAAGEMAVSNLLPSGRLGLATTLAMDSDPAEAGKARLFSSPFSKIGHTSPVHDAEYLLRQRDVTRPHLPAASVEGSYLLPFAGDRAAANADILGIGGQKFDMPTWLQGGRDYPLENAGRGAAWASEKSAVSRLLGRANEADAPVHGVYSAMGERSIDFSHHVSDTLVSMAQHAPITDVGLKKFDGIMREADPKWPGLLSHRAQDYLASAPGGLRVKLAKEMDKAEYRDAGFPRVDHARFAATDPELVHVPTGASGGSVSRLTGDLTNSEARHRTYRSVIGGDYQGQFGNVPVEVMFPDLVKAHLAKRPDMLTMSPAERDAAHVSMFMHAGNDVPMLQKATPEWVERVSRWQEMDRMGDLARLTP